MSRITINVMTGETTVDTEFVAPSFEESIESKRAAAVMDREAFALAAAEAGYVTYQEAAEWKNGNAMPDALQTAYNALDPINQGQAYFDIMARNAVRRMSPWMPGVAAAFGTDDAGIDALFGIAP